MRDFNFHQTLEDIERNMAELAPYRKPALFNEFLVEGYSAMTLSSVPQEKITPMLEVKLCMGTLITLYDDFADRPAQSDPQFLEVLYQLNFGKRASFSNLKPQNIKVLRFASALFAKMEEILEQLPQYHQLIEILNFDLMQFYLSIRYCSLVTAKPFINNLNENRNYTHHNMGMVIVATMDLMATKNVDFSEFGLMREVFLMGQRMGRIFNLLATRKREAVDGDFTGELALCQSELEIEKTEQKLRQEVMDLHNLIGTYEGRITTFSVKCYLEGLMKLQRLHEKMEGII